MSHEFKHASVGGALDREEWEGVGSHVADSQQANDMLYFNGTYWVRATPATILGLLGEGARVYNSSNISISNNTATALTFDTERFDTNSIHSTASNTSRLTCQAAGKYLIIGQVNFAANATGYRAIYLKVNNTTFIAQQRLDVGSDNIARGGISSIYQLAASDYVELIVLQTSGGNLNVTADANQSPEFMMMRIG